MKKCFSFINKSIDNHPIFYSTLALIVFIIMFLHNESLFEMILYGFFIVFFVFTLFVYISVKILERYDNYNAWLHPIGDKK